MSDAVGPATGPEPLDLEPATDTKRRRQIIIAAVVIAVVVLVGLILTMTRRSSGYSADDQQQFMTACTANGGEPVRGACGCIYDQMTAKIPYERFVAVNNELAGKSAPVSLPTDIDAIRADCVARTSAATTAVKGD